MGPSGNDGAMRTPRGGAEGGMEVRRAASLCPRRLPSGLASRRVALRFVPPPSSGRVPQAPQGDGFPEGEAKWMTLTWFLRPDRYEGAPRPAS